MRVLPLLLAVPFVLPPIARAAEPEEIVVTATRRAAALTDVPASVSVIGGARAQAAASLNGAAELERYLSGVEAAVANGTQIAFQIRGVGAVDHQALTPGAAAVYADGVFLATNVQTGLFLYDLDRIEVLKGPQGTLYGRNASSGAINVLTARPGRDQTSYIQASYGRFDRVDLAGAVGTAISERVSARLAGRFLSEGPTLDNIAGPKAAGGEREEYGARASLLYEAPGGAQALLRGHYEADRGVNQTPRNAALDIGRHEIASEGDGVQDTDNAFFGASVETTAALGRWEIYSLTAYEGYDQLYGFDFDGTPAPFGDPTLNANLRYDRQFEQLSEEIRASADFARARVLLGFAGSLDDFSQDYLIWCGVLNETTLAGSCPYVGTAPRVATPPASSGTAVSLLTHIEQERASAAIFTRNEFDLTERLVLTLGARLTHEDIEAEGFGAHIFDDGTRALNDRDGAGPAIGANRIIETRVSGTIALLYRLSERASLYASFANGHKSGGFNGEVQNNATHWSDEGLFGAETVDAWEIGAKFDAGARAAFNATLFFQSYDDPQARIFVDFPLPDGSRITSNSLANLDAAVSYGVEWDARWAPLPGLDLSASFTWLETEIRQTSDIGGNAALFDGNPLPFAPRASGTLFVRYEHPVAADVRASLQANLKAKSEIFLDAEGLSDRRQAAYASLDAAAALHLDARNLELSLWGRNLSNEDVAVSGFGFIGYNTFRSAPRTFGVAARLTF